MVHDAELDLFFDCELGGTTRGFKKAWINVQDLLDQCLKDCGVAETWSYQAMWGFGGAAQPVAITLYKPSETWHTWHNVHAQVSQYILKARPKSGGAPQPACAFLVVGNMHIISSGNQSCTIPQTTL